MKTILFSNYDFDENEVREEMIESGYYDEEDITDDEMYYFWEDTKTFEFDDIWNDMLAQFEDEYFVVYGTCGRWDGTYSGAIISDEFKETWYKVMKDCDYMEISIDDGDFKVFASHHDGNVSYTFRILNEEGVALWEDWLCDYEDSTPEKVIVEDIVENYTRKVEW